MIDLKDGELLDIIPKEKADADSQARSYAIKKAIKLYVEKALNKTLLYTSIDTMPEDILDYMAVELDVSYYSQSMNIDMKRNVIKNAIPWYMTAGSTKAVEDMVNVIFGGGEVIEWYDFETDKTPGYFDIETEETSSGESYKRISDVLQKVKNASSHLREIVTRHELKFEEKEGFGNSFDTTEHILNDVYENNPDEAYPIRTFIGFNDAAIGREATLLYRKETLHEENVGPVVGKALACDSVCTIFETMDQTDINNEYSAGTSGTFDSVTVIGG